MNGNLPTEFPSSPAALFDLLQRAFGVGSFDELVNNEPPWFKVRMTEIAKIRSLLKARKATVRQVAIAAWYAQQRHVHVSQSYQLFRLIPEAMRTYNREVARNRSEADREAVIEAANQAIEAGETAWADRLIRVAPKDAASVLEEWKVRQ